MHPWIPGRQIEPSYALEINVVGRRQQHRFTDPEQTVIHLACVKHGQSTLQRQSRRLALFIASSDFRFGPTRFGLATR